MVNRGWTPNFKGHCPTPLFGGKGRTACGRRENQPFPSCKTTLFTAPVHPAVPNKFYFQKHGHLNVSELHTLKGVAGHSSPGVKEKDRPLSTRIAEGRKKIFRDTPGTDRGQEHFYGRHRGARLQIEEKEMSKAKTVITESTVQEQYQGPWPVVVGGHRIDTTPMPPDFVHGISDVLPPDYCWGVTSDPTEFLRMVGSFWGEEKARPSHHGPLAYPMVVISRVPTMSSERQGCPYLEIRPLRHGEVIFNCGGMDSKYFPAIEDMDAYQLYVIAEHLNKYGAGLDMTETNPIETMREAIKAVVKKQQERQQERRSKPSTHKRVVEMEQVDKSKGPNVPTGEQSGPRGTSKGTKQSTSTTKRGPGDIK